LYIQTWSVPSKQNLILKQAFHSILIRQLCQSTGYYEIEFSSIVRRVISSALTQEGTVSGSSSHQYNLLASDPDGQSQLEVAGVPSSVLQPYLRLLIQQSMVVAKFSKTVSSF
jgi:hypothetical protein